MVNAQNCETITNATVDIWHCDALGIYSHFTAAGVGGLGGMSPAKDNTTFLRGIQYTDSNGLASFDTIFPGFYVGRDTHIHIKVHIGGSVIYTGQLFVNDTLSDIINTLSPYNQNPGTRTRLEQDMVYSQTENASYGMLTVRFVDQEASYSGGLIATVTLGVDPSDGNTGASLQSPLGKLISWVHQ